MYFYIENYGCAANQYDGDVIRTILTRQGIREVSDPNKADIVIINTCIVKKVTEDRMRDRIKKLEIQGKPLIVTGCMAEALPKRILSFSPRANIVGLNHIDVIPDIIKKILNGEQVILVGQKKLNRVALDYNPSTNLIATVPISQGCLGACTFCITRFARGSLVSYPIEDIVNKVRKLVKYGVREIRLTGQDIGPYGTDIGTNLVNLLEQICDIEGLFRVRIGMASPDTIEPIFDDLLDLIRRCEKIYKFLHIPVQSGSERILQLMKRRYGPELFINLVNKARKKIPEITIATDIIVAFPTETEEDHLETIELLKKTQPDVVNISRYGDRPNTLAMKLKPKIHSGIAKRRSAELTRLVRNISLSKNKRYKNKTKRALILDYRGENRLQGRLDNYKLVFIDVTGNNIDGVLGSYKHIKINEVSWKALYGELSK